MNNQSNKSNQSYKLVRFSQADLEVFFDGSWHFGLVLFTLDCHFLTTKPGCWNFHKDQQDVVDQLNAIEPDKRGIRYAKVLVGDGDKPYIKSIEGIYWEA